MKAAESNNRLDALARRVAEPYRTLPTTRGILLTGSVAESCTDRYSDVDIILYHESAPSEDDLQHAMRSNGAAERKWLIGDPAQGSFAEAYMIDGVECQFGHATIAAWQADMDSVLVDLEVKTPNQKALSGLLEGIPLLGEELIEAFKAQARAYPDALTEAMVVAHLSFFAIWGVEKRLASRDALLWRQQALVENTQNVLGVLAGLNRLYYTTFQFKRMAKFVSQMSHCPPDLTRRIDGLFLEPEGAPERQRQIVAETVSLVETHMRGIDTSAAHKALDRREDS